MMAEQIIETLIPNENILLEAREVFVNSIHEGSLRSLIEIFI